MIITTTRNEIIEGKRPSVCGIEISAFFVFQEDIHGKNDILEYISRNILPRMATHSQKEPHLEKTLVDALQKHQNLHPLTNGQS